MGRHKPTLIHFNICGFIGKTVEIKFFCEFHGRVARPIFAAFSAKFWNEFYRPPDSIQRNYNALPGIVAPGIVAPATADKAVHIDARIHSPS